MAGEWYYEREGQKVGPVTNDEIGCLMAIGKVTKKTLVWTSGMDEWKPISKTPQALPTHPKRPLPTKEKNQPQNTGIPGYGLSGYITYVIYAADIIGSVIGAAFISFFIIIFMVLFGKYSNGEAIDAMIIPISIFFLIKELIKLFVSNKKYILFYILNIAIQTILTIVVIKYSYPTNFNIFN